MTVDRDLMVVHEARYSSDPMHEVRVARIVLAVRVAFALGKILAIEEHLQRRREAERRARAEEVAQELREILAMFVYEKHWTTLTLAATGRLAPTPVPGGERPRRGLTAPQHRILRSPTFGVVK